MSTLPMRFGLFLFVCILAACHSYTVVEPGQVVDYKRVRLTIAEGDRVDLYEPTVEGDSITGRTENPSQARYVQQPTAAFALADVKQIEGVRGQPWKSFGVFLLSIAGVLAVGVVVFLIACGDCMGS